LQLNPQDIAGIPVATTLVVAEFVRGLLAPQDDRGQFKDIPIFYLKNRVAY
jgi:hypothetical protein